MDERHFEIAKYDYEECELMPAMSHNNVYPHYDPFLFDLYNVITKVTERNVEN